MLLCGELYLNEIELLALVFSFVLGILQPRLDAFPRLLLYSKLSSQLLVFLLQGSQGLGDLGSVVGLNPSLIPSVLDPFLRYKNLLGNLHKNDKGILCKNIYKEKDTMVNLP